MRWTLLSLWFFWIPVGCDEPLPHVPVVTVESRLDAPVDRVVLEAAGGMPAMTTVSLSIAPAVGAFSARLVVPSGTGRIFTLRAYTGGVLICAGRTVADVPNATGVRVAALCDAGGQGGITVSADWTDVHIDLIGATSVVPGQTAGLQLVVTPGAFDLGTIRWSASSGTVTASANLIQAVFDSAGLQDGASATVTAHIETPAGLVIDRSLTIAIVAAASISDVPGTSGADGTAIGGGGPAEFGQTTLAPGERVGLATVPHLAQNGPCPWSSTHTCGPAVATVARAALFGGTPAWSEIGAALDFLGQPSPCGADTTLATLNDLLGHIGLSPTVAASTNAASIEAALRAGSVVAVPFYTQRLDGSHLPDLVHKHWVLLHAATSDEFCYEDPGRSLAADAQRCLDRQRFLAAWNLHTGGAYAAVIVARPNSCSTLDAGLVAALRAALGTAPGAPIDPTAAALLTNLAADNRGIRSVAGIASCAPSLQRLGLSNNLVSDLRPLATLSALRFLYLGANPVGSDLRAAGIDTLTRIEELSLASCGLRSLAGVERLASLRTLFAGTNALTSLDGISGLTRLESLEAQSNAIAGALPALPPSLRSIQLARNGITSISSVANLPALQYFHLNFNAVTDPSPLLSSGIGPGGFVFMQRNALACATSDPVRSALVARGVYVDADCL